MRIRPLEIQSSSQSCSEKFSVCLASGGRRVRWVTRGVWVSGVRTDHKNAAGTAHPTDATVFLVWIGNQLQMRGLLTQLLNCRQRSAHPRPDSYRSQGLSYPLHGSQHKDFFFPCSLDGFKWHIISHFLYNIYWHDESHFDGESYGNLWLLC